MCKIDSSEHNILSYKCNDLKFCEHELNSAQSANFVSTNLKTPVCSLIASVGEAHRANTTLIAQTRTHQFTEVSGESICGQIHFF